MHMRLINMTPNTGTPGMVLAVMLDGLLKAMKIADRSGTQAVTLVSSTGMTVIWKQKCMAGRGCPERGCGHAVAPTHLWLINCRQCSIRVAEQQNW